MRKLIFSVLFALAMTAGASAQKFIEYGLKVGLNVPEFSTSDAGVDFKEKLGWQAGFVLRINTPIVAIQPELLYVRHGMDFKTGVNTPGETNFRMISNSLELPVLASLRLFKILHINAGPVFSIANSCKYKDGENSYNLGRLQPAVGYAVGLAVKLGGVLIDARYNGNFSSKQSEAINNTLNTQLTLPEKVKSSSFALSLGYLF